MEQELSRAEAARGFFMQGYNCAQSVVLAYADHFPFDKEVLVKLASSFGGGMGRLREVCGAFSGMIMVLGMVTGYTDTGEGENKKIHYAHVQELAKRFEQQNGTIICRDLLKLSEKRQDPTPEKRTEAYYHKRPCADLVASAAAILEQYLKELNG